MTLVFVYGSLKEDFPNWHVNAGVRLPGTFMTRERLPMYLLGQGHVPCIVLSPGVGHNVCGEVYRVSDKGLASMDRLERLGEANGYQRVGIEVESVDTEPATVLTALVYVKMPAQVVAETQRIGPLAEYTLEHAKHLTW